MSLGDQVTVLAETLLLCLETELNLRDPVPAEVCLVPGEDARPWLTVGTAQDRCCSGFGWVRVVNVNPFVPVVGSDPSPCGVMVWQVDLEMGVARCAPWGTVEAGPSCQVLGDTTRLVLQDMEAMVAADCCLRSAVASERSAPTNWLPFGADGGCVGGIMGVSVQVDACGCVN